MIYICLAVYAVLVYLSVKVLMIDWRDQGLIVHRGDVLVFTLLSMFAPGVLLIIAGGCILYRRSPKLEKFRNWLSKEVK